MWLFIHAGIEVIPYQQKRTKESVDISNDFDLLG